MVVAENWVRCADCRHFRADDRGDPRWGMGSCARDRLDDRYRSPRKYATAKHMRPLDGYYNDDQMRKVYPRLEQDSIPAWDSSKGDAACYPYSKKRCPAFLSKEGSPSV